jgi:ABC-type multidrug transport system fused ATPase/permease subunit
MMGTLFLLAVYAAILIFISPIMTLVSLLTAAISSLVVHVTVMPKTRLYGEMVSRHNNDMHTAVNEELSAIRLIKMLGQEDNDTRHITTLFERLKIAMTKVRVYQGSIEAIVEPIFVLGLFTILYMGATFFNMSLAALGTLVLVLLRMMPLAKALNTHRGGVIAGKASLANIENVIQEARASRKIVSGPSSFDGLKSNIKFDHVSFSYADDGESEWTLEDVSFTIPRGTTTAIVGRSGAGKSTMVDLIPRLRDATVGRVLIDEMDIQQLDLESLRKRIGFLSQESFLFNTSVRNNIAYGFPTATPEQVSEAARMAYADGFIEAMPLGYDTIVGDRGIKLSAGQRQRLGIARIMLQNPDIIILDEPTSALDSESEHYIQMSMNTIRPGKTFVVIAHRLSTIQQADQIVLLDKGKITEQGNHTVLLSKNGDYSRLFDLQIHV